jgi:uncharacterized protein YggE
MCFLIFFRAQSQTSDQIRYIEVTGSAELNVDPDEVSLIIGIEEYWKEEFEKKNEPKDYRTKVKIEEIEKDLLSNLSDIGISKEQIKITDMGNYWRYRGKEFLISKQYEITLYDMEQAAQITKINTKGINYMTIGELKNKSLAEFRKQVKIEALKAAHDKAEYLLNSINKKVGDALQIIEENNDNKYWRPESMTSNTIMSTTDNSGIEDFKKIKLRYEIKVRYEIK